MLKLQRIDPLDTSSKWDEMVRSFGDHTVFHLSAWARVMVDSYGHEPYYCAVQDGEKTVGLLPLMEVKSPITGKRGISLPFSDFCGLLLKGEYEFQEVGPLLNELVSGRCWKRLELRGGNLSVTDIETNPRFVRHALDLRRGIEKLHKGVDSAVRRALKKANESNLVVAIEEGEKSVDQYYELHTMTRRRHGLPPQPKYFFDQIADHMIRAGNGFVVLVHAESRPIAGGVFFHANHKAVYKFGASDERFWDRRPNQLMMWRAIQALCEKGCRELDFGRTDVHDEGLKRFKRSWGSEEHPLRYKTYRKTSTGESRLPASSGNGMSKIFRHLPLSINRLAGRLLYPHLD